MAFLIIGAVAALVAILFALTGLVDSAANPFGHDRQDSGRASGYLVVSEPIIVRKCRFLLRPDSGSYGGTKAT
jgi:hypothetical protein